MNIKLKICTALILSALFSVQCQEREGIPGSVLFTVTSEADEYDGTVLAFPGDRTSIEMEVSTDGTENGWETTSPTKDSWITTEKIDGKLYVTVDINESTIPRTSYIKVYSGKSERTINVTQDYYRKLQFFGSEKSIGASSGVYTVFFNTNVLTENLSCTLDQAASAWITNVNIGEGVINFFASRNTSTTAARSGVVTLSGDGKNAEITIIQNPLTGKAYIVNISSIAWEESSVYNIMASGEKVGEICKEYIYKYDDVNAIPVVRGSMMIAYPMNISGNVDYANGYVIDNGGSIIWNTAVTVETAGNEMIAQYNPGSLTVTPSTIYFPDGASSFTHIQMGAEDMASAITADTEPMLLVDVKSGEANTAGETTETITYGVVKIGRNYWLNTNYASSRYADGSNIPTNIANAQWTNISNPGCLVSGTSSTNTYLDANSSNATTTRRTYGCLYNWQALTGAVILPDQTTETDRKSDIISPEGWSVPSKDDYTIMRNYITQGSPNPTTDPLNECYTTATTTYANITGFNGLGTRSRGYKSGGYNTGTYYWTIDYTFKGSNTAGTQDGHMGYILSLNKSTNITTIGVSTGCYLRLIKD